MQLLHLHLRSCIKLVDAAWTSSCGAAISFAASKVPSPSLVGEASQTQGVGTCLFSSSAENRRGIQWSEKRGHVGRRWPSTARTFQMQARRPIQKLAVPAVCAARCTCQGVGCDRHAA
jgi:hypothetical protein